MAWRERISATHISSPAWQPETTDFKEFNTMVHTNSVRRHARGFTLVELLVVTLILSILMAVALPLYLSAVKDSRLKTNRANMQTIANAVQAKFVKDGPVDYSGFAGAVDITKEPDLQNVPKGPDNETYSVVVPGSHGGAFAVTCSDASVLPYEPGYDNK